MAYTIESSNVTKENIYYCNSKICSTGPPNLMSESYCQYCRAICPCLCICEELIREQSFICDICRRLNVVYCKCGWQDDSYVPKYDTPLDTTPHSRSNNEKELEYDSEPEHFRKRYGKPSYDKYYESDCMSVATFSVFEKYYCCSKKCIKAPNPIKDELACEKCQSIGYCKCECETFNKIEIPKENVFYCCAKRCMKAPEEIVDGPACDICNCYGYCRCLCKRTNRESAQIRMRRFEKAQKWRVEKGLIKLEGVEENYKNPEPYYVPYEPCSWECNHDRCRYSNGGYYCCAKRCIKLKTSDFEYPGWRDRCETYLKIVGKAYWCCYRKCKVYMLGKELDTCQCCGFQAFCPCECRTRFKDHEFDGYCNCTCDDRF